MKSFDSWSKLHPPTFFPSRVGTLAWNKPYIGGPSRALRSSGIFERKGSISLVPWKMLLSLVVRRRKSLGWKNGTRPWTVFESSQQIISWFTKGPWLLSCYTSLFCLIKLPSISLSWPTCGNSMDVWPGLVPLRPRWPCVDTNSVTTIVSLLGQPLNTRCTFIISLVFPPPANLFHFQFFFRFFHNQQNKESLFAHTAEDLEACANV